MDIASTVVRTVTVRTNIPATTTIPKPYVAGNYERRVVRMGGLNPKSHQPVPLPVLFTSHPGPTKTMNIATCKNSPMYVVIELEREAVTLRVLGFSGVFWKML